MIEAPIQALKAFHSQADRWGGDYRGFWKYYCLYRGGRLSEKQNLYIYVSGVNTYLTKNDNGFLVHHLDIAILLGVKLNTHPILTFSSSSPQFLELSTTIWGGEICFKELSWRPSNTCEKRRQYSLYISIFKLKFKELGCNNLEYRKKCTDTYGFVQSKKFWQ